MLKELKRIIAEEPHCPEDSQQENRDDDRGSTDVAAVRSEYPSGSDTYEPWHI